MSGPTAGLSPAPSAETPRGRTVDADNAATVALTLLTLAAVASLSRLFSTGSWVWPVVTATIAMHAVAWACRRWGLPALGAAAVSIVAVALVVSWLVLPGSTHLGLPLSGTWAAASQAIRDARDQFHAVTAPAPATHAFVFVTVLAVCGLVLIADWAAFRMRATLEAAVPSFTLFVFSSALGGHRGRTATIALELAALLAFALVHQSTVMRQRSAWFANRTDGVLLSTAKVGAVIGVVAILLSLNVSFRLPGSTSRAVVKWRAADRIAGGGPREAPNPIVDLRSHLLNHTGTEVFTVKSTQPAYWRLTSLDTYKNNEWGSENTYSSVRHSLPGARSPAQSGVRIDQFFNLEQLDSPWLPAAYEPDRIDGVSGISYDAQSGSLITSRNTSTGLQYHVSSVLDAGQLNPAALEGVAPVASAGGTLARYLQLPPIPADVVRLAQQITAGKSSEYDKARALQDYLRAPGNFTYDETFDPHGDAPNALEYFLFRAKRGYCQQFAGSFAIMARAVGIPTRLALGWTWGTQDAQGVYHVTDDDTHTWPEVYFPGAGWAPFEPTPGRGNPAATNYTGVLAQQQGSLPVPSATATPTPTTANAIPGATVPKKAPKDQGSANSSSATAKHHQSAGLTFLKALAVVLLVAGVWVLSIVGLRRLRWARRRREVLATGPPGTGAEPDEDDDEVEDGVYEVELVAAPPSRRWWQWWPWWTPRPSVTPDETVVARAEVLLAWAETLELLAWWGERRRPDETYLEFARRAGTELRLPLAFDADAPTSLAHLARAATKAEYAGAGMTASDGTDASEAAACLHRALIGSASGWQRARLVLDPRAAIGRL